MKGSDFRQIGNITLGCISPEARELLDTVMEEWEKHRSGMKENLRGFEPQDPVYAFAYWLVRYSGLIEPARQTGDSEINLPVAVSGGVLTVGEMLLLDHLCSIFNEFLEIMGNGSSREGDAQEVVLHIHALQRMVLSQAAARAYPDRYRLLGDVVEARK